MLIIEQKADQNAIHTDIISLSFEFRCKNRLRTRLDNGHEVWLFLERGTVLRDGDLLKGNDGRIVLVKATPEKVMEAISHDPLTLLKAAYHLGNRHVAVEINTKWLRFNSDHVLAEMVKGLGLTVNEVLASFEPESGAYGKQVGHAHGNSADGSGARIHDMQPKTS